MTLKGGLAPKWAPAACTAVIGCCRANATPLTGKASPLVVQHRHGLARRAELALAVDVDVVLLVEEVVQVQLQREPGAEGIARHEAGGGEGFLLEDQVIARHEDAGAGAALPLQAAAHGELIPSSGQAVGSEQLGLGLGRPGVDGQALGVTRDGVGNAGRQVPARGQLARDLGLEALAGHALGAVVGEVGGAQYPHIPLVMHQDHGTSPAICQGALNLGFGSVMMDGSLMEDGKTPSSFEYNVDVTRKVVEMAHKLGATVEGELGCLGSLETGMAGEEDGVGAEGVLDHSALLTDPEEAAQFVKATQLDALAIAIGTSHGAYKFTRKPTGDILSIQRVKEIHARLPNTHLVMHGSSSVPQELLEIIRQYGGAMKETYRVPVEEIQEAIKHGVRKINIDTDIRLAMTGAVRKFLAENPEKFDAREWLKPAREAAKQICKARYIEFGCEGQGAKIKGYTLEQMAAKYAAGSLQQVVN